MGVCLMYRNTMEYFRLSGLYHIVVSRLISIHIKKPIKHKIKAIEWQI